MLTFILQQNIHVHFLTLVFLQILQPCQLNCQFAFDTSDFIWQINSFFLKKKTNSKFPAKMKAIYNALFKRTSTYTVGILASVFFFERAFDVATETIFENANKGVSIISLCKLSILLYPLQFEFNCRNCGRTSNTVMNKPKVDTSSKYDTLLMYNLE